MTYVELGLMALGLIGVFVGLVGAICCAFSVREKDKFVRVSFAGFVIALTAVVGSALVSTADIVMNFFS